jgi:hypothetical protein
MEKIDLRKQYQGLYHPSAKKIEEVDVPSLKFVMLDGIVRKGEKVDQSEDFSQAMEAMYGMSYTLKFASKLRKENPIDFTVMALEALWWVANDDFEFGKLDNWLFTAMMMQPDHITNEMFEQALTQLGKKRPSPALRKLKFETFREGPSIQVMHLGPYSAEPATIDRMKAYISENGYVRNGKHHEIYLGDPRRANPSKLKTILRQPVRKV